MEGEAVLRVVILEGQRREAAPPFGRVLALAVVTRLVGRDAKEPGLELALALEILKALDHRQKDLLANLLGIFPREVVAELEDESSRRRIMKVEQLLPRLRLALAAAGQQPGFAGSTHAAGI